MWVDSIANNDVNNFMGVKMKKEDKKLIISMIGIIIIACILFACLTYFSNNISLADNNPFPEMRACEEQYTKEGMLYSVEYIEGGYQNRYTLIVISNSQMRFKDWDNKRFKPLEGQNIEMVYYSNYQTSEYYLNCLDHERFGYDIVLKPLTYKNG